MRNLDKILIVSCYRADECPTNNALNHETLIGYLGMLGIPCIELQGQYKGQEEKSLLFHEAHRQVVEMIARDYNQDCYLESDHERYTSLVFPDGSRVELGTLSPVDHAEAGLLDSWTYRRDQDRYYAVR